MCIGALTMDQKAFVELEVAVFDELAGKLGGVKGTDLDKYIESVAKSKNPALSKEDISRIIKDAKLFDPIDKYLDDESIEDIMINNTSDIFVYRSSTGQEKVSEKLNDRQALDMLVRKCRMYVTEGKPDNKILDLHLPNGSRANIVDSPLGADITIRNFKKNALSIIDMVNAGEFSYNMAGRLWIYAEGLRVRPANLVIGGMPGSGKTTLLNAMFSR